MDIQVQQRNLNRQTKITVASSFSTVVVIGPNIKHKQEVHIERFEQLIVLVI